MTKAELDEKSDHDLIKEIHQGLYGVPDTAEKGLCGIVKDQGIRLAKMEGLVWKIIGALTTLGLIGTGAGAVIKWG